ncbi:hypothetical protein GJ744_006489 [Endocarpon pusillum]|uniref:Uncharacterized protein n=1 Tax=Endocarpon pusillum TaxID=364733 RepID=A0A8H7AZ95_9EURO|nr:hypothetical protein GJ744_006489 [Endocarpon pusillum]
MLFEELVEEPVGPASWPGKAADEIELVERAEVDAVVPCEDDELDQVVTAEFSVPREEEGVAMLAGGLLEESSDEEVVRLNTGEADEDCGEGNDEVEVEGVGGGDVMGAAGDDDGGVFAGGVLGSMGGVGVLGVMGGGCVSDVVDEVSEVGGGDGAEFVAGGGESPDRLGVPSVWSGGGSLVDGVDSPAAGKLGVGVEVDEPVMVGTMIGMSAIEVDSVEMRTFVAFELLKVIVARMRSWPSTDAVALLLS